MEFRVLGPIEVLSAGAPLRIGGPRQRAVLAALLSAPNETVRRERLIDLIWDEPPAAADLSLRQFVWRLREALRVDGDTEPRIVWDQGFRLRVEPGELDLWRFEEAAAEGRRALAEGRPAEAAEAFRRALDLVRGEPYQGADASVDFEAARAFLTERRRGVVEQYFQARLALGEHADIVDELRRVHAEDPLREALAGHLMLALYRSGRGGDALAVYRDLRARLVDELGAEPGRDLSELHRRMLRGDPALDGTVRPVSQLPSTLSAFSGRAAELSLMDGGGPVVVMTGTAGVGKTTLAVHWAHTARDRFPDGQLYVDLRGFTPGAEPLDPGEALRGFLVALGVPAAQVPDGLDPRAARFRELLAGARTIVVLDNARDAAQVRPLLPGGAGCRVVITSRDRLTGLVASSAATVVPVDTLTPEQARDLLAARLGAARVAKEPEAVDRVIARCAALPLALALVAARAAGDPGGPLGDLADELDAAPALDGLHSGDPVTDPRTLFAWSYRGLSTTARRVFQLSGLHPGPDFSLPAVAALAGLHRQAARAALAELTEAHLLTRLPGNRHGRHDLLTAFATELAAEAAPDDREPALRRMHDHYLGTALEAARLLDPRRPSRPTGPPSGEALADAGQALAWLTAEYPVLVNGVGHAHRNGLPRHSRCLAWALVSFQTRRGRLDDWIAAQRVAIRAATDAADAAGSAAAHQLLAMGLHRAGRLDEGDAVLHTAFELFRELDDKPALGGMYMQLGHRLAQDRDYAALVDTGRRAHDLFAECGDVAGQARALGNVTWGLGELGDLEAALAEGRRSLDLYAEAGNDPRGVAEAHNILAGVRRRRGEYPEAIGLHREAIGICRSLGFLWHAAGHLDELAGTYEAMGAHAEARRARSEAAGIRAELA